MTAYPPQLPPNKLFVDFTITKSWTGGGTLLFRDAAGDVAYRVAELRRGGALAVTDAAGSTLVTLARRDGQWMAYEGNSLESEDVLFTARVLLASACKTEIDVFLSQKDHYDTKPKFRLEGSPFCRGCIVARDGKIVAQSHLLYRLRKYIYLRRNFRVTIYPENDHVLVIAMLVTFFGPRRS